VRIASLQNAICWMLILITPASLLAADAESAMLFTKGVVLRNGVEIPNSSAVFSGDLLETKANSVANLTASGSSVIIFPGSLVQFQGKTLSVEHGSVSVATSHGISVRVKCITVVPVSSAWTQFEVTDVNGAVGISAKKNDIRLDTQPESPKEVSASSRSGTVLREGDQTTRDESDGCKNEKRKKDAGAVPAGTGGPLNSELMKYGGLAALGGLGLFLALEHDDPPSPWKP
jgi:hypothetical protein